jgi:hypothetical protein
VILQWARDELFAGVPAAGGSAPGLVAVAGGSFLPALLLDALLVQLLLALQLLGPLLLLAVDFFLLMEALLVQLAFLPLNPLLLLYVSALLQFLPLFLSAIGLRTVLRTLRWFLIFFLLLILMVFFLLILVVVWLLPRVSERTPPEKQRQNYDPRHSDSLHIPRLRELGC